jgi:type II secretory pathway pseudopilin PulG
VKVKKQASEPASARRSRSRESGFTLIELAVVCIIAVTIMAIAVIQIVPSWQSAKSDNAMRVVVDQLRQAREYSIANRRYVQITFPVVNGLSEIVITQIASASAGETANKVLSTVYLPSPMLFQVTSTMPDTPDKFNTPSVGSSATQFRIEGTNTSPVGPWYFQSDGELIDNNTSLPIDGTISLGTGTNLAAARAVTVMGATGRVHGWRSSGVGGTTPSASWFQF